MNGLSFYNCTLPKVTNLPTALVDTPGRSQTIISHKQLVDKLSNATEEKELPSVEVMESAADTKTTGMALPFEPLTLTFENVQYFADTPKVFQRKRLQLLQDITGAFRPGILTALMGVSGAGKTTLMDVFFGRKTGGITEREIRGGGYPKVQETYARISSYCKQTDINSPQITIEESVIYSAWLRLPAQIDRQTKSVKFLKT
ncbi:hypothetical protein Pint_17183 [Pistacia integerrima]|uniref:Uncharacterized protein n=1 Tax=Pistacia integerrima TaxID=434235 RepID=A0ACC0Z179_9ROSI|nr:hypothetical protein Pint_17183 [Pistacia integerrima]